VNLLRHLRPSAQSRRVVAIGLDGTPYTFARRMTTDGAMPNLARLLRDGSLVRMSSSHPDVSAVAWSSFMTGTNPGKHGIYGFSDRRPSSYQTYIATAQNLQGETLWEVLSRLGRRVCVIGVPMTYPPRPVNGVLVGCFLSPSVEKAAYPPALGQELKEMGYRVDIDPWAARESRERFLDDYRETLSRRVEAIFRLLQREDWDLFMAHIIETDRLHHFLWQAYEDQDSQHYPAFLDCYRQVDDFLGRVAAEIDNDRELIILSDHGSCAIRQEVYLNQWLGERGYLKFRKEPPESLEDIDTESVAYSLDPGRVYINLRGREPAGCVAPGAEYERLREELARSLSDLRDPDTGELMVARVYLREEIYCGPAFPRAPDLLVQTRDGYDAKGSLHHPTLTGRSPLTGMHTFDDAMLYIRGARQLRDSPSIVDVMPTILRLMDIPVPDELDGQPCL
jgi:predicted AlkP superfamily phosphohydrolase/phosphomutase